MTKMEKTATEINYLSTSDLIDRGWTRGLIKKLMPAPCKKQCNYYTKRTCHLYDQVRAAKIEEGGEFKLMQAKASIRSKNAKEVAESKRKENMEKAENLLIEVTRIESDDLTKSAIDSYNWHHQYKDGRNVNYEYIPACKESDTKFLNRIKVNYIRHELTCYEENLAALFGKIGRDETAHIIRRRIFDKIKEVYPELAEEVERQVEEKELQMLTREDF